MKKYSLFIVSFLMPLILSGQIEKTENFLYLFSDSKVYGNDIKYFAPFFGKPYFIVDSMKFSMDSIKFLKNETGFYARKDNYNLIKLVKEGRVNLFEWKRTYYKNSPGFYNVYTGIYFPSIMPPIKEIKTTYYYNKGFGDVKKINYQNLKNDLSDNPQIMLHLDKYKSLQKAQISTLMASCAFMVGTIVAIYNTDQNNKLIFASEVASFSVGILLLSASFVIKSFKPVTLRSAIYDYNR